MESKVTHLANLLQFCIDKKAHLAGKLLHSHILRNGYYFQDVFLPNRLIEFYSNCGRSDSSFKVFSNMPARNVYSWNALVSVFAKNGRVEEAYDLFVEMPERNTVSWNTMISALARNGCEEKAVELYYMMNGEGFKPTLFTFASVFSACGSLDAVEHGRRCHAHVIKVGLNSDMYVENALVGMYAKCGSTGDAVRAFNEMSRPNEVSFTAMIGGLANTDHVDEALKMFSKMHQFGIRMDPIALSSILGVCARGIAGESGSYSRKCGVLSSKQYGLQVYGLTVKLGFESDIHVSNSLLDMYAKHGSMDLADMIFVNLPKVNVVSWNIMIAGYGHDGQCEKALELLRQMQSYGFEINEVTYVSVLGACVKSGDLETAREIFHKISHPSVSSWNAILSGYSQKARHKEALDFFRTMQFQGIRPDQTTIAVVFSSCAGMGVIKCGKQVHAASTKEGLHVDIFVASAMVDMYSKCGNLDAARSIFDRMPERDIVCWNSMVAALAFHSLNKEALILYKQMGEKGMGPTQFSYATILNCCSSLASLPNGRQIHGQIIKDGYTSDVFVGTALIDMYSKCGNVDEARWFFDEMHNKNIVSWNEMIHGYAQSGRGVEAIELFECMVHLGHKPDTITFIAVLTACSHCGLVDVGMRILNSMEGEYMVQPFADHYTCIIDSLGRSGRFVEAEVLLEKMPSKDDPIVWEVLLSACRLHSNSSLGRRAAEQLIRLDPHNATPYVLLSNIYASLGRWDDASAIRKLMSDRAVVKDPAYSWIEEKDKVQAFMVDEDLRTLNDGVTSDSH